MITTKKILIIIPARGGSKGIPRKNLRTLAGRPLIYYSIQTALSSEYDPDVYVSTDDAEIGMISEKVGAKVVGRGPSNTEDDVTLDPVIYDAYQRIQSIEAKNYDIVVTVQPTSPLLKKNSLDTALRRMFDYADVDTIISATDNTHLTWRKEAGRFVPNYEKRLNRQFLNPIFKETGAFLVTRSEHVKKDSRIGSSVELQILNADENIDIDTYQDWSVCEYLLRRKKVLFVVSGHREIGLGHVYNTLNIANDIVNHQIEFLVDNKSQLAFDKIASRNYPVRKQLAASIVTDINKISPDVVINDCLDTTTEYIEALHELGCKVINFEDLGPGAKEADLVINAIYPEQEVLPKHYFGHKYFLIRDEFLLTETKPISPMVGRVLLTFGGVDPNNYTFKVLSAIYGYCVANTIEIVIILGFGYSQYETLRQYPLAQVLFDSVAVAEQMSKADIIFTSAGRTTYEAASLRVPTIVLAQNNRELTHFFASSEYGFLNVGLGTCLSSAEILEVFLRLVDDNSLRNRMSATMAKSDLKKGRGRVLGLINRIVEKA